MNGIVVSEGIAIGKGLVIKSYDFSKYKKVITKKEIKKEEQKFIEAKKKSLKQLEEIYNEAFKTLGEEKAEIFEGHMMLLDDEQLEEDVFKLITENSINAVSAVSNVIDIQYDKMMGIEDEYLRERAYDVKDIGDRILKNILNIVPTNLDNIDGKVILITENITPSDIAQLDMEKVIGIINERGGKTSHSAIIARSYGLPAIVGEDGIFEKINTNDIVVLDAVKGDIIVNPDEDILEKYNLKLRRFLEDEARYKKLKNLQTVTLDGRKLMLEANIGNPIEVKNVLDNAGEGIGLYRTEFLYMDRTDFPSESEQFEAYKETVVKMEGRPVIIRTLDVGGDKNLDYFEIPKEENPFLGWRAIRVCLDRPAILEVQLRAILRASAFGKIKIMFPMVIAKPEILQLRVILEKEKAKLDLDKIKYDKNIEVGIMIETPAAAVTAEILIKYVDFFSIGTNDLTQYTLAVDRGNEHIEKLYDPFNPGVLKLMKMTIDAGKKTNKDVGMCGEFAGDIRSTVLLVGMGLTHFSMSAMSILKVKNIIRNIEYKDAKKLAKRVLKLETSEEVLAEIAEFLEDNKLQYYRTKVSIHETVSN